MRAHQLLIPIAAVGLLLSACGGGATEEPTAADEPLAIAEMVDSPPTTTVVDSSGAVIESEPEVLQTEPAPTTTVAATSTAPEPSSEPESSETEIAPTKPEETAELVSNAGSAWVQETLTVDGGVETEVVGVFDTEAPGSDYNPPPQLRVVCFGSSEWDVWLDWDELLEYSGEAGGVTAQYQIDGGDWITETGTTSLRYKAWFPPDVEDFISKIIDAQSLLWQPLNRDGTPDDRFAVFPVAGLRSELETVTCEMGDLTLRLTEWIHDTYTDDFGGQVEVVGVWDTETLPGGIFDPPLLLVVCTDGREWEAQVDWGNLIGRDFDTGGVTVQYQIDGGGWTTDHGFSSTDFSGWFPRHADDFIAEIVDAQSLLWRPLDSDGTPVDKIAVFPVAGLRSELETVTCELAES